MTQTDATTEQIAPKTSDQQFSRECALIAARAADEKKATDILVQDVRDMEATALAGSSSALRRRVAEGRSIRYLTMARVRDYIDVHALYRAASSESAPGAERAVGTAAAPLEGEGGTHVQEGA